MTIALLKKNLLYCIAFLLVGNVTSQTTPQSRKKELMQYQCIPCGYDCDKEIFNAPGKCGHCGMVLVKKSPMKFKNIEPEKICAYIKQHPDVVLLDVRTKKEFEGKADHFGTLKNAINIPIQELQNRLSSINSLKNTEIIVYCSHSHRSPQASYLLTQNGFTRVINLSGGMSEMRDHSCKK